MAAGAGISTGVVIAGCAETALAYQPPPLPDRLSADRHDDWRRRVRNLGSLRRHAGAYDGRDPQAQPRARRADRALDPGDRSRSSGNASQGLGRRDQQCRRVPPDIGDQGDTRIPARATQEPAPGEGDWPCQFRWLARERLALMANPGSPAARPTLAPALL